MKLGLYTDVHFSKYSSIIQSRGDKYTTRLENCITSINWAEEVLKDCDKIICLGDFFDKAFVDAEVIEALNEINWNSKEHYFLLGNHEIEGQFNNLKLLPGKWITESMIEDNIAFIPFGGEELWSDIVLSHNMIKGIQMGGILSNTGIDLEEIKEKCKIFVNGHLHSDEIIGNYISLGNLTGQNFSENAQYHSHNIMILDTENFEYELIENPYAFNFYKLDKLIPLKNNAVITLKTKYKDIELPKEVIASRIILEKELDDTENEKLEDLEIDHIESFKNYILMTLGSSDLVKSELEMLLS